ncbi:MAG: hypothetical protein HC918_08405 [Oscillatoriales cyanobacterium SM2_1_8]|nr:hypothetical protein [Oscillatoriales cyanobacterium SM2_1_8]
MAVLIASTLRRLRKLPRTAAVWEGDCRPLPVGPAAEISETLGEATIGPVSPCLLWVDSSAEMVRAMQFVEVATAREGFVQVLIQAMECPQSPAVPSVPAKILVRDRTLQFFLQEVLQDLAIQVEYDPYLPLIDEIFANLQWPPEVSSARVPDACALAMQAQVAALQELAPWYTVPPWRVVELVLALPGGPETLYATVVRNEEWGGFVFPGGRGCAELLRTAGGGGFLGRSGGRPAIAELLVCVVVAFGNGAIWRHPFGVTPSAGRGTQPFGRRRNHPFDGRPGGSRGVLAGLAGVAAGDHPAGALAKHDLVGILDGDGASATGDRFGVVFAGMAATAGSACPLVVGQDLGGPPRNASSTG